MKKYTEKLIKLIEPLLESSYEWESAVSDITMKKAGMSSVIATPYYNKIMYADVFKNLTEQQYIFIKDIVRLAKNYVLIEDMKANRTFDQEVQKDADKWIEENKSIKFKNI